MLEILSGNYELNSAEVLAMRAEKCYQDKQFIEAAKLYEQAAAKADANRQAENMFRYNQSAAHTWEKALAQLPPDEPKIEYQTRLLALLRKLTAQNPNHPEALEGHFRAIDVQVQIVLAQPKALDDYLALVEEHTKYWSDSPQLPRMRQLSIRLLEQQGRIAEAAALLPMLDAEQLETLPPEIQRLRVRQLDSEGKTQEAVDILMALLIQKREPATVQLFAEILTRQSDEKSLNRALDFWRELEPLAEKNGEMWWTVREGIIEVLCKLNRRDEAKRIWEKLQILYPELGGAERKARLLKQFEGK
jgi:tetratricopeptide (TPR) repeat protein